MKRLPYFENLSQIMRLYTDEHLIELLAIVEHELGMRGKLDARNYITRARHVLAPVVGAPAAH